MFTKFLTIQSHANLEKGLFLNLYGEKYTNEQKESLAEEILRMWTLNSLQNFKKLYIHLETPKI